MGELLRMLSDDSYRPQVSGRFAAAGLLTGAVLMVAGIAAVCFLCWMSGGEMP